MVFFVGFCRCFFLGGPFLRAFKGNEFLFFLVALLGNFGHFGVFCIGGWLWRHLGLLRGFPSKSSLKNVWASLT